MANSVKIANSLKDMASSVDWGKMMSRSDAKHALIGSALGGLLLGGSSMLGERDPEDSKYAPVGDALTGALLGGVAGYGIPKGLAMFRDSGTLAPDNDKLRHNFTRAGIFGGVAGLGAAGLGIGKTLHDEVGNLQDLSNSTRAAGLAQARQALQDAISRGDPMSVQNVLSDRIAMYDTTPEGIRSANRLIDNWKDNARRLRRSDPAAAAAMRRTAKELRTLQNNVARGYDTFGDLVRAVGTHGESMNKPGIFGALLEKINPKGWLKNWTSARHYHSGRLLGGLRLHPGLRMGLRAGKYGLAGAGAALLLHKLLGPSTQPNFKK